MTEPTTKMAGAEGPQEENPKKALDTEEDLGSSVSQAALEQVIELQRHVKGLVTSGTALLALIRTVTRLRKPPHDPKP